MLAAIIARGFSILFIDLEKANWKFDKPDLLMEYGVIARNILKGLGYSYTWLTSTGDKITVPTAYMPPGQVFIDYLSLALLGDNTVGVIGIFSVNLIMSVLSVYLIGKITKELFNDDGIVRVTLWIAAIYPFFLYTTASFGVTSAVIFINALIFLNVLRLVKYNRIKYALIAGIGFGLLHLFRGEAPLFLLVTIILLLIRYGKVLLPKVAVMTVIALAILAPWTIRNAIVFERFVPISSNGGFNFWRGNNAMTVGSPWTESGGPLWSTDELWAKAETYLDSGVAFDKMHSKIYFNDAAHWITSNSTDALLLSLKKALIFWTIDRSSPMGGRWEYIAIYSITFMFLLIGIYSMRKKYMGKIGIQLIICWCVLATLLAMVFFPLSRLQVISIATYFPIVGYGVYILKQRFFLNYQFHNVTKGD